MKTSQPTRTILLTIALTAAATAAVLAGCAPPAIEPELAIEPGPATELELETAPSKPRAYPAPDGLTHVCSEWPDKCVTPSDPDLVGHELGLICCGDGWCLAIVLNSDCGPAGSVYYCGHGQTIVNTQGLPDVECFD